MRDPSPRVGSLEGFCFPRLSEGQCRKIHEASLEILDRVGVRLYLEEAVDLLRKAGAGVTEGNRVRVPASLVETSSRDGPQTGNAV